VSRLPLLSARPAVTPATLKTAATIFAAWWTEARWVWTVCLRLLPDRVVAAIWTRALLHWVQHASHSPTSHSNHKYCKQISPHCLRNISRLWLAMARMTNWKFLRYLLNAYCNHYFPPSMILVLLGSTIFTFGWLKCVFQKNLFVKLWIPGRIVIKSFDLFEIRLIITGDMA